MTLATCQSVQSTEDHVSLQAPKGCIDIALHHSMHACLCICKYEVLQHPAGIFGGLPTSSPLSTKKGPVSNSPLQDLRASTPVPGKACFCYVSTHLPFKSCIYSPSTIAPCYHFLPQSFALPLLMHTLSSCPCENLITNLCKLYTVHTALCTNLHSVSSALCTSCFTKVSQEMPDNFSKI